MQSLFPKDKRRTLVHNSVVSFLVQPKTGNIRCSQKLDHLYILHSPFFTRLSCFKEESKMLFQVFIRGNPTTFQSWKKMWFPEFLKSKDIEKKCEFQSLKTQVAVANILIHSFSEFGFKSSDLSFVSPLLSSPSQTDNLYSKGSPSHPKFYWLGLILWKIQK